MSERARMYNAVPRGMIRFSAIKVLSAKPINDDMNVNITSSLPPNFGYVFSYMFFELECDTATDWNATARFRMFNGIPNASVPNDQVAVVNMSNYNDAGTSDPKRIADMSLGDLGKRFPTPVWRTRDAAGMSAIVNYANGADPAQAAGLIEFHMAFYQYDLTQVVRFPLNFPLPVGNR